MKKYFYPMALLLSGAIYAQTGKVGVNTETPTETLQVKGTARITDLPLKDATNSINTKTDGTASQTKNQTFTPTKTLVVDKNGVVGVVNGLPVTELPEIKTIKYKTKTVPIDAATPNTSVLELGNVAVRLRETTERENALSFKIINNITDPYGNPATADNVIINQYKVGSGGHFGGQNMYTSATKNQWYDITNQKVNINNRDFVQYWICLVNTKEMYRLSVNVNRVLTSGSVNSPAQVTLFLERLTDQ